MDAEIILLVIKTLPQEKTLGGGGGGNVKSLRPYVVYPCLSVSYPFINKGCA